MLRLIIFILCFTFAYAQEQNPLLKLLPHDHFLGDPKAKVLLIEYSSLSCPHCSEFHKKVLPKLKEKYIDKGKVLYIYRNLPTNYPAVLGMKLLNCVEKDKYFNYVNVLMESQELWAYKSNFRESLLNIAKLSGMPTQKVEACFNDAKMEEKIFASAHHDSTELKIEGSPTFFINGIKYMGIMNYKDFSKIIEALL